VSRLRVVVTGEYEVPDEAATRLAIYGTTDLGEMAELDEQDFSNDVLGCVSMLEEPEVQVHSVEGSA
jgi:hypothetical protein